MRYTLQKMEADLRQLVTAKGMTGWHVGGAVATLSADGRDFYPALRLRERANEYLAKPPAQRTAAQARDLLIGELTAFCFRCYETALNATGDQVIGRVDDLKREGVYQRLANMMPNNPTYAMAGPLPTARNLFQNGARGNALLMDKWATMMNDSWLLGGMHRGAPFRLASPLNMDNLWNRAGGYLIVTARELLGLTQFGYTEAQAHPNQRFTRQTWKSRFISIIDYDAMITTKGATMKTAMQNLKPYSAKAGVHAQLLAQVPRA